MNNKLTVAIEYNSAMNLSWVADQVVQLVKSQTRDIYLISQDPKFTCDVLAEIKAKTEGDAEYHQVVQRHNIQIHVVPEECLNELADATPIGNAAVVAQDSLRKRLAPFMAHTAWRRHSMATKH
jgi:hypothetical protein